MRIRIETSADVRRYDTYELEVPDDFDINGEGAAEEYLQKRLDEDDAVDHVQRRFEDAGDKYPVDNQNIDSWQGA
ncbi:hypothetical protein [Nocardia sp. NPDC060249]|uniref:hypothetical protein n=1 Tax=Nocardia sp. NPDC060249 TaxID=3347082 RepID=UPI00364931AC